MSKPLQPYTSFPIEDNEDNSQGSKVSSIDSMLIGMSQAQLCCQICKQFLLSKFHDFCKHSGFVSVPDLAIDLTLIQKINGIPLHNVSRSCRVSSRSL